MEANVARYGITDMGLFTGDIATDDLLLLGSNDIYSVENQIIKSLPKVIDAAINHDLSKGPSDYPRETKNQIARLNVPEKLAREPQRVRCPAINGLIDHVDEIAGEVADKGSLNEEEAADKKLSTMVLRKGVSPKATK